MLFEDKMVWLLANIPKRKRVYEQMFGFKIVNSVLLFSNLSRLYFSFYFFRLFSYFLCAEFHVGWKYWGTC